MAMMKMPQFVRQHPSICAGLSCLIKVSKNTMRLARPKPVKYALPKRAIAATATKPESAVHNTVADTPRRARTTITALPMMNQRKPPRSSIASCGGNG